MGFNYLQTDDRDDFLEKSKPVTQDPLKDFYRSIGLTAVFKSGRAFNGSHRDSGKIVHLIKTRPSNVVGDWFDKAICGAEPGIKGNGWHERYKWVINCPKCIEALEKIKKVSSHKTN